MNGLQSLRRLLLVLFLAAMPVCSLVTVAGAQGFTQFPGRTDPTNNFGFSGGSDTIPVSSGMLAPFLPKIPNLQFGFQYSFGKYVRTGRFTADYVLPVKLSADSVVFGEAHAEGWDFRKRPNVSSTAPEGFTTTTSTANNRIDLSFGGGYRTMLRNNTFLGVNGFYDTSRLYDRWYSSGGVGLEMAANVAGDDAIDLNFNWYGNLFNRDVLVNAFRNKGNSFDLEAGYSHALFDRALDLRLKFAGYQFDIGNPVYGWRSGADLTTKNGMFSLRYEYGKDRLNGQYNTIGGFMNVGFQVENLLRGESPITLPEPVFKSPRSLGWWLTRQVKRNWHQPTAVVQSRTGAFGSTGGSGCGRSLASLAMLFQGSGNYASAGWVAFPAFPYTSLDPTKFIVVELDYTFDAIPPANVAWLMAVSAPAFRQNGFGPTVVAMPVPPSTSGHLSFTLNTGGTPFAGQGAFTLAPGQDPDSIAIMVYGAFGTTDLQIRNVCIRFNQ